MESHNKSHQVISNHIVNAKIGYIANPCYACLRTEADGRKGVKMIILPPCDFSRREEDSTKHYWQAR